MTRYVRVHLAVVLKMLVRNRIFDSSEGSKALTGLENIITPRISNDYELSTTIINAACSTVE